MKKYVQVIVSMIMLIPIILTGCSQQMEMEAKQSSIFERAEINKSEVTTDTLPVKSGAGNSFTTITNLNQGDRVDVMGEISNWQVIRLDNNQVGCIDQQHTKPIIEEPRQPEPPTGNDVPERDSDDEVTPVEPVPDLNSQESQMINLVNDERKKYDLTPLKTDKQLTKVSRIKSQDMVDNDYFSHYSPTYGTPFEMMDKFGIKYLQAGENLAANTTVKRAHDALMNSKGHRQNILNPEFTHIGIGIKRSDKYGFVFTQLFIQKPE